VKIGINSPDYVTNIKKSNSIWTQIAILVNFQLSCPSTNRVKGLMSFSENQDLRGKKPAIFFLFVLPISKLNQRNIKTITHHLR
jgi:hypothetical protein